IASGSQDQTVKMWDAQIGLEAFSLEGHTAFVSSVSFSPDGRTFASGSKDGTVRLWDVATGILIAWRQLHGTVRSLWFNPETPQLHVADDGGGTGQPRVYLLEIIRPDSSRP